MSPHRSQAVSELCNECRGATQLGCPRCAQPLCATHMPEKDQRCDACEAVFLSRTRVERHVIDADNRGETYTQARRPFLFAPFGVMGLLAAIVSLPAAAILTAVGLLVMRAAPPTVPTAKLRHALKRKRFLGKATRKARRLAARRTALLGRGDE